MDLAMRELGRTGLQVTTLGYGAMELRGAPRGRDVTEEQADTILNKVLDSGINYIDTSIDYGLSEERIGRYISHRRAEYYLASKCGCLVGAPPAPRGQRGQHVFTRDNVVAGVEQSLVRMKTDYLDVVQFHSSPSRQILEEHGALEERRRGQARAWLWERIDTGLHETFRAHPDVRSQLEQTLVDVDSGRLPVSVAARRLLGAFGAGIAANARRH